MILAIIRCGSFFSKDSFVPDPESAFFILCVSVMFGCFLFTL